MRYSIHISGLQYEELREHLYPGDGKEAVAIALCGRLELHGTTKVLVHKVILIPHEECSIREPDLVCWPTELLSEELPQAMKRNWTVLKIHSHPTGYERFSRTDDKSDVELLGSIYNWMDSDHCHGSAVMLPNGRMFARILDAEMRFIPVEKVCVAGDDMKIWHDSGEHAPQEEFSLRTRQAFGQGTVDALKRMRIAVIGCSGTGSPVIEQLARLGVGKLLLVDPDHVEKKNLNRILNSTMEDAVNSRPKVSVIKNAIENMGLGCEVEAVCKNAFDDAETIKSIASCDAIFGCVDSIDGRHLLSQIASFYLVPYFDLGIKLVADGSGGIEQICGTLHYVQPMRSSLLTRGLYTQEELRAAYMRRSDIREYEAQVESKYIVNVSVESPAVISVNMQLASMSVNDFLARVHGFRNDPNSQFATTRFSLTDSYVQSEGEGVTDMYLLQFAGRGDMVPFLNMTSF